MPLVAVESRRLYRQIADQLAALIATGEFSPGSRLPPERELAGRLGVSRASVREAVICLELAGAVEVRVGTGIFVSRAQGKRVSAGEDAPRPFDILSAREAIEGEVAAIAARRVRAREVAALRDAIERMRAHADDVAQRDAADRAFHLAIAAATGNAALTLCVAALWDLRSDALWTATARHFHTRGLHARRLADHEAIVAALAAHDPQAARAAMRRHLARVARQFQRRIDPEPPAARRARPVSELK